jgi:DNA-binding CsgD family transcriptional regulator
MLELSTTATEPELGMYLGPERRAAAAVMTHWLARMLDEMDHGMVLVTPAGALRHANQPARSELAGGTSLRLLAGGVHTTLREQQGTFTCALAEAGRGRRRLLTLGCHGHALPVAVVPMADDARSGQPLVLLVFGKRQNCEALTVDFFARTQGLTGAEARVLQALCKGLRPKDMARQFDVAVTTVRTQIMSIRSKTQTASIRALVSQVTALPPITLAMKSVLPN